MIAKTGLPAICTLLVWLGLQTIGPDCWGQSGPPPTPFHESTNVVFISIDTLRHDHLGCYGYSRNTSEKIDTFAMESVVFQNFISQAALTPISQMSIFTSQDPRVNGMNSFEPAVETVSEKTLAHILKQYGYTNAAFSSSPEFFQSVNARTLAPSRDRERIFGRSFDVYLQPKRRGVTNDALNWLESNKDKKFLWLPLGTVHWPYTANVPPPYNTRFDPPDFTPFFSAQPIDIGKSDKGIVTEELLGRIYQNVYYGMANPPYSLKDKDVQSLIAKYDAGIYYTDLFVGQILSLLERLNLSRKTVVVLHSIHGEDLGEHGYFYHYDVHDTEVKNALIIRFPESKFGGKRIITQVQGIDIVPTLLDYLDIPINHEAEGISLMPLIRGEQSSDEKRYAYSTRTPLWEYLLHRGRLLKQASALGAAGLSTGSDGLLKYRALLQKSLDPYDPQNPPHDIAIRTNEWKLILRRDKSLLEAISWWAYVSGKPVKVDELELYDLIRDPYELKNIADKHPEIAAQLQDKLLEWDRSIEQKKAKSPKNAERFIIPYP